MRKILALMSEYRQEQLRVMEGATPERIAETGDYFRHLDDCISGLKPTSAGTDVAETMHAADFPQALGTFVSRQLVPGYTRKRFDYEQFVKTRPVSNYNPHTDYQSRAGLDDMEWMGEKGEARAGSVVDAVARPVQIEDWSKQFDFSWRALVNDDLGYFQDQAFKMGQSARRTKEKFVSRLYTNATSIARLVALGALYWQSGQLTTNRISEARMAFNQRLDARGEPINARLKYIIHHSGLVDTVRVIRQSAFIPELATNAANVIAGDFVPIEDPYIVGVAPVLPWWALADYRDDNIVPFVLAEWSNMPNPLIIRKASDMESMTDIRTGSSPISMSPMLGDYQTNNVEVKVWDTWGTYIDDTEGNWYDTRGGYYSDATVA